MAKINMSLKVDASQLIGALKKVEQGLKELDEAQIFVTTDEKLKRSRGNFTDFLLRILAAIDCLFSKRFRLITFDSNGNIKSKTNFNIKNNDTN
ncbi:MAG: hypothetical protein JZU65_06190 [Chlorobium sp.]|jgi:hypothetical protein|nr:hypothetical protein [Chlorobium sp.]